MIGIVVDKMKKITSDGLNNMIDNCSITIS